MGSRDGRNDLERIHVHPAQGRGISGVHPENDILPGRGNQGLEGRGRGELEPSHAVEEPPGHDFPRKLHEAKAPKKARPSQGRQLFLEELPKDDPIALQRLPDALARILLFVQRVTLPGSFRAARETRTPRRAGKTATWQSPPARPFPPARIPPARKPLASALAHGLK